MKQQFEYTQKEEQLSSIETLKKELVFFKINAQSLGTNELKKWLLANVARVGIAKDEGCLCGLNRLIYRFDEECILAVRPV